MDPNSRAARAMAAAMEHYRGGDLASAEREFAAASRLAPEDAQARNALGVVVAALGRVDEALTHFRAALDADPRSVAAATNRADAALNLGRLGEARETLDAALAITPGDPGLHALRAETLAAANQPREALASARRWAALSPDDALAQRALGTLASRIGAFDEALAALRRARALDAGTEHESLDLRGIASCLEFARFGAPDPQAEAEIATCLYTEGVESQTLARPGADLLLAGHGFAPGRWPGARPGTSPVSARDLALRSRDAEPADPLALAERAGWPESALMRGLLERTINVDPRIEGALVACRRALLDAFERTGRLPARWRRLAAAMATQCFVNEHAWPIEPDEHARVARIAGRLVHGAPEDLARDTLVDTLIVAGLYRPLASIDDDATHEAGHDAGTLADRIAWPASLGPLVERALREPLAERALAADIARAPIADEVSAAVRDQYEESPYPRWVDLPEPNPEPLIHQLADQFPGFVLTPVLERPHRILIAGCGSGRHPLRVARGDPTARVVAIDLSVASLAYALRRARELGVENVEFRQHDILDARDLDGEFAVIESSGVIHHMREPAAGLAALAAKLSPGGVMKLGLYSRRARRLVTLARGRIAALGLDATPDAMRAFRAEILAGRVEGLEDLAGSSDLYALSACRDLLFHVQEHQYSPREIGALLAREKLEFLGFQLPAYSALERFRERFPEPDALADLDCWDRFEESFPGTFANTFALWCQKPG